MRSMNQRIQFMVSSTTAPRVELSDAGVYVRFLSDVEIDHTVVQNEWPHIAVDLAADGRVIGIEAVPAPDSFTVGMIPTIAAEAGVGGLPEYRPEDVQISHPCAA